MTPAASTTMSTLGAPVTAPDPLTETVARVVITPAAEIRRILPPASAKRTFPEESTAMPVGKLTVAFAAGPPSPEEPGVPFPATVAMIPSSPTRRIR